MADSLGIRFMLIDKLYDLLALKYHNKGIVVNRLEEQINATEAMMDEEDVAWVKKKITQLTSGNER